MNKTSAHVHAEQVRRRSYVPLAGARSLSDGLDDKLELHALTTSTASPVQASAPAGSLRQGGSGGLLKRAANITCIAVRKVRALHHQNVGDAFGGIDPGLSAPGSTVAV